MVYVCIVIMATSGLKRILSSYVASFNLIVITYDFADSSNNCSAVLFNALFAMYVVQLESFFI